MTVAELIAELQNYPDHYPVLIPGLERGYDNLPADSMSAAVVPAPDDGLRAYYGGEWVVGKGPGGHYAVLLNPTDCKD